MPSMMPPCRPRGRPPPNDLAENDDSEKSGDARTPNDWLSLAMWSAPPMVPFEELQRTFAVRYPASDPLDLGEGTVVVLPSLSFPTAELRKIVGIGYYEERLLFLLLLLRRPGVKVVYLTSMPVEEAVVDYYLGFLPDPAAARSRLHMLAAGDPAPRSLTAKLLDRPELLDRVRELCEGPGGRGAGAGRGRGPALGRGGGGGGPAPGRAAGPARRLGRHQAQRRLLRPGQRRGRAGRPQRVAAGLAGGVLRRGGVVAVVRSQDRGRRGGGRGAAGRPRHRLPPRAAAHRARRGPGDPVHPQPGPRRPQPPGLPGLPLPGRPGLPRPDPGRGRAGRPGPGRPRGHRLLRDRLLRRPLRRPRAGLPVGDQPQGRRHHPPVRDGLAGHRRPLRRRRRSPGGGGPDQSVPCPPK